jgi:protein TonB
MYVPPPPPLAPPPPPKKPSPVVPLLIFGAIALVTVVAAIAAGLMVYVSMRDREARPPASELPVVEKPREPKPAPAFVDPEAQEAPAAEERGETPPAREPRPEPRPGSREPRPVPPDAPPPRSVRVGDDIVPPTKIRNVNPVYPQIAQSARVQGTVVIEATIDREGKVSEARVLRSIPLLDQAALDAVRQWEYEPTLLNGEPVPVIMTVTVNFTLR